MFVLNDVMNDDMKYFKWHTTSINAAQVHVSVVTKYDLFTAYTVMCNSNTLLPIRAYRTWVFHYSAEYEYE